MREGDTNPCLGIKKNPKTNIARFLDADELARLGRALDAHEARWPEAVAAVQLLAHTGCRRSEVLDLRRRDVGGDAINLPDAKTGPHTVPLGEAARAHTAALPGARTPMRSCPRSTPKAGAPTALQPAGGRFVPMQCSAGSGCMT